MKFTKENVERMTELLQAYTAGKVIQIKNYRGHSWQWEDYSWIDGQEQDFTMYNVRDLRVKPCVKYRPFKDMWECWNEMKKHQPVGWLKCPKNNREYTHIRRVDEDGVYLNGTEPWTFEGIFEEFIFIDGGIFGTREEEKWVSES